MAKFQRAAVNTLLAELDFEGAAAWDHTKMITRLKGLSKVVDDTIKPKTPESQTLYEQITAAIAANEAIELEGEEPPAKKKGKGKEPKPAKEKKEKPAKKTAEVDKFGSRKGTTNAAFNAALTSKPQTMAELVKKASLPGTRYNHANDLLKKKLILRDKETGGYMLNPKTNPPEAGEAPADPTPAPAPAPSEAAAAPASV